MELQVHQVFLGCSPTKFHQVFLGCSPTKFHQTGMSSFVSTVDIGSNDGRQEGEDSGTGFIKILSIAAIQNSFVFVKTVPE